MTRPDAPAYNSGGGGKKKKKHKSSPSTISTPYSNPSSYTPPHTSHYTSKGKVYNKPSYTPPPSYSKPVKYTPPAKTRSLSDIFNPPDVAPNYVFGQGYQRKGVKPQGPSPLIEKPEFDLSSILYGDPKSPDDRTHNLMDFLQGLKQEQKAPKDYFPGLEKIDSLNEFAWVPKDFRQKKNGQLKQWWDQDFINSALSDLPDQDNRNFFLNGIMEKQFQDRENWMLGKNERHYNKIKDVLDQAAKDAFEGNYNTLSDYMQKHPNFKLDSASYRSKFGITPESIWADWEEQRRGLTLEQRQDARYRIDMMMRHYEKLRSGKFFSFQQTNNLIDQAVKKYKDKYNESVEFGLNSSDDKKKSAAENAGPAIPELSQQVSDEQQSLMDAVGEARDPRKDWMRGFLGHGVDKRNHRAIERARQKAKTALGMPELPTVKEMLTAKVLDGSLDPKDESAVADWIHRFENPNHPDTRAMYVAFAHHYNPAFDVQGALKYVNAPIKKYVKDQAEHDEAVAKVEEEQDKNTTTGFGDFFSDAWKRSGDMPIVQGGSSRSDLAKAAGDESSPLGWTFDKLARLSYGVAGMANAYYSLDNDNNRSKSWVETVTNFPTGANSFDAVDEFVDNPGGSIKSILDAGYQQTFRGAPLPGIKDNVTPITWSQVIANNAARDSEDNLYDKDWYQHVAGFGLDIAADPLNLVGVGVIDDTLKIPARVAKGLSESAVEGAKTTEASNFLRHLNNTGASPVVEKTWRVNQVLRRVGDDITDPELVSDAKLFGEDPTNVKISEQLRELHNQEKQLLNDIGVQHLNEQLGKIDSELASVGTGDLRVQRLMAKNSIKIHGEKVFENRGGRFWRDFLDPLERTATSKGYSDTVYADTVRGREAQQAESELNRVLDDIDSGALSPNDPAVVKKQADLNKVLDDALDIDEATGKPSFYNRPRTRDFLADNPEFRTGFDPVKAFAEATGLSRDEFTRTFSDSDVYDALTMGQDLLVKSDPVSGQQLLDANDRISEGEAQLAALDRNPNVKNAKAKRQATLQNLQIGYTMRSELTLSGALRYLDTLQDMRNAPRTAEIDDLTAQLGDVNKELDDLYDTEGYVLDEHLGDYYGSETLGIDKREPTRIDDLHELRENLTQQIEALKLDQTDEVTGFPPAQAYKVERLLPANSQFRKADGSLDFEKIGKHVTPNFKEHKVTYKKPENATKQEVAFLDIIKNTIQHEYRGAYRGEKTKVISERPEVKEALDSGSSAVKRLGPRPTASSLRKRLPNYTKREIEGRSSRKADPKDLEEIENLETEIQKHTSDIGALERGENPYYFPDTSIETLRDMESRLMEYRQRLIDNLKNPKNIKSNEYIELNKETGSQTRKFEIIENGGKRTKRQMKWEDLLKDQQRKWDKKHARAVELDKARNNRAVDTSFKVTVKEQELIAQRAYKKAVEGVIESLKRGEINRVPGNMRLTINETAADQIRRINLEAKYKANELKIQELEANHSKDLDAIRAKRAALEAERKDAIAAVEKAKQEAHQTRKVMTKRIGEEHVLQAASMPARPTGRMIQFRILGMRKNLQFTNNLFKSVEAASRLVPAKIRENFANYMVRPTKQFTRGAKEAIYARAVHESKTPVIIKANLERMSERMHMLSEPERRAMMLAYRDGTPYEGSKAEFFSGVEDELREIEDIWNGTDEFYQFRDPSKATERESLTWWEINRFLPQEWQPSIKVLKAATSRKKSGKVSIENLRKAIKANGQPTPKDLDDPYRFSWVMRMAADQARQNKALVHTIKHTFGVQRSGKVDYKTGKLLKKGDKADIIEQLHSKYGWQTVKRVGEDTYFPPEALHDVNKLLDLMEPGKESTEFGKVVDKALGYWKQGVTIYNPGYYTRNGIGEIMASWLDGVNHPKWYRMASRVHKFSKGEGKDLAELMKKWSVLEGQIPVDEVKPGEVLFKLASGRPVTAEDAYRMYIGMGLKSTFVNTDLENGARSLAGATLTDNTLRKGVRSVNKKVHDVGEGFEDWLRMAHFLHAMEHSGKKTLGDAALYASERVTKYHFDYSDFSNFEKSVMLRVFPFYKWTRRGAPLMLAHLFMTPGKMLAIPKALDAASGLGFDPLGFVTDDPVLSTSDVHDDKNGYLPDYSGIAPGWVRDLFAYQMQPAADDEYANYFRVQTPQLDGLNAVLNIKPGSDLQSMFADSGGYPLLNPAIKMPIELAMNKGMDPDFPYEIFGGEYNEMNGINPAEAIAAYAARNLNPITGFLAKLSKNGDLGPASIGDGSYKKSKGYDTERDIASFATGLGFYQGMPKDDPNSSGQEEGNNPPVGLYNLSDLPVFRGVPAAQGLRNQEQGSNPVDRAASDYAAQQSGSGWINYPDRPWIDFGSGWRDFGNSGWINYGNSYGGYGGGGYSGGSVGSVSSTPAGTDFLELIQQIMRAIDQGKVIDD